MDQIPISLFEGNDDGQTVWSLFIVNCYITYKEPQQTKTHLNRAMKMWYEATEFMFDHGASLNLDFLDDMDRTKITSITTMLECIFGENHATRLELRMQEVAQRQCPQIAFQASPQILTFWGLLGWTREQKFQYLLKHKLHHLKRLHILLITRLPRQNTKAAPHRNLSWVPTIESNGELVLTKHRIVDKPATTTSNIQILRSSIPIPSEGFENDLRAARENGRIDDRTRQDVSKTSGLELAGAWRTGGSYRRYSCEKRYDI
jgi:hypothetical protein